MGRACTIYLGMQHTYIYLKVSSFLLRGRNACTGTHPRVLLHLHAELLRIMALEESLEWSSIEALHTAVPCSIISNGVGFVIPQHLD